MFEKENNGEDGRKFHIAASFTNEEFHCYFSDVTLHYHENEYGGGECKYSPTGYCNMYDSIQWMSYDKNISDKEAVLILIDRIEKVLNGELSGLTWSEKQAMLDELNNFEIWSDHESE